MKLKFHHELRCVTSKLGLHLNLLGNIFSVEASPTRKKLKDIDIFKCFHDLPSLLAHSLGQSLESQSQTTSLPKNNNQLNQSTLPKG